MVTKHIYPQSELPEKWHYQILSFLRIVWPEGFVEENQFRNWITKPKDNPISIILAQDDVLISHVQVVTRQFEHVGNNFCFFGLTGVFTYPAFRNQGWGKKVVMEGRRYIDNQAMRDVVLLSCEEKNLAFYEACGWKFNDIPLLEGDDSQPALTKSRVSMEFVSPKAKLHRDDFVNQPMYFDDEIW